MRSTPARMLHNGQLIVDRHSVSKITAEPFRLPHNTVSVELVNQLSGEKSKRNLRWDEHVTTEEPLEVKIGETGKIRVELAQQRDEEASVVYRYKITDEAAGIDHEGADLRLGPRLRPDNVRVAKTLLSFLYAAGESYFNELEGRIDSENADLFGDTRVNEWAYLNLEDIEVAQVGLIRGLER
jgi:hypothetical protein